MLWLRSKKYASQTLPSRCLWSSQKSSRAMEFIQSVLCPWNFILRQSSRLWSLNCEEVSKSALKIGMWLKKKTNVFSFWSRKVKGDSPFIRFKVDIRVSNHGWISALGRRKMLGKNHLCCLSSSYNFNNFHVYALKAIWGKDLSVSWSPPFHAISCLCIDKSSHAFLKASVQVVRAAPRLIPQSPDAGIPVGGSPCLANFHLWSSVLLGKIHMVRKS